MSRGDSGFTEEVYEDDQALGQKISFEMVLLKQVERTTFFLSRLNDTPSYVFHTMANPGVNLDPLTIKPNRDNFIYSVITMKSLLVPFHDKKFTEDDKALVEQYGEDKSQSISIKIARQRFNLLMELMARKSLLPIQSMV